MKRVKGVERFGAKLGPCLFRDAGCLDKGNVRHGFRLEPDAVALVIGKPESILGRHDKIGSGAAGTDTERLHRNTPVITHTSYARTYTHDPWRRPVDVTD